MLSLMLNPVMRDLLEWDPLRGNGARRANPAFAPAFEIRETASEYVFRADLPGVKQENLDIQLVDGKLTVRGKREAAAAAPGERWHAFERSYGEFERSFALPRGVDGARVSAKLEDGVLTLVVPKAEGAKARKIPVA